MAINIEEILNGHGFGTASVNLIKAEFEPGEEALVDGLIWYKPSTKETRMYMDGGFRLLAAHGTYFTKFSAEHLVLERTKKILVDIPEYKPGIDFIQVAKDGNALTENIDYYVDKGTREIFTMKGDWLEGERFSFEIAIITTVPFPNNSLFLQLEDHVYAEEGKDIISFNIPQYLPEYDLLRVHQRNLEIFKDIDWNLAGDRQSIKLNYKTKEDEEFHFTVIKQVRGNTQGLLIDGSMLVPGSIPKESLGFVVDEINPEILEGIVTDRENRIFQQYKDEIAKDKETMDTRFDIIYENVFLRDPVKTQVAMAKTEFDEGYEEYKEIIERALLDMDVINDERLEIQARLETYRARLTAMVTAFENALDNIGENRWATATSEFSDTVDEKLEGYVSASLYMQDLDVIKNQLDGNITSWFYPHDPMLSNEPAISWETMEQRNVHLGDLFYDTVNGYAYRFAVEGGEYKWIAVQDTDVQKALAEAAAAQDTADSKRRVFVVQPIPPYDIGDLWVQGEGGDILTSLQNKLKGDTFNPTDWILASRYTDDSRAIEAEINASAYAKGLNDAIKKEIDDVSEVISTLDTYIDGAFKDGVISETEQRDIRIYVNVLQSQKADVDNRFSVLTAQVELDGAYRATLQEAKTQYDLVHTDLIQTINSSIADGLATDEERLLVDSKFESYNMKISILTEAFETAVNYIAEKKALSAESAAKAYADGLKLTIDNEIGDINSRIGNLDLYIDNAFLDRVIDITEKESIRTYIHQIDTEKADIDTQYTAIYEDADLNPLAPQKAALQTAKAEYNQAHNELKITIIAAIDDTLVEDGEYAAVNAAFAVYRTKLSVFSLRLKEAVDVIMLKRSADAEERAVQRANNALVDYVSVTAYTTDFENIQAQLDGSITSWFYPHEPTLLNEPASNWPTNVRNGKLGDLFYNTVTGYAYRFALESGEYKWLKVQDTDVQKALRDAASAQDTADKKRRVFVVQPIAPYDQGDLWTDGQTIYRALINVAVGVPFSQAHWERVGDVTSANTSADTHSVAGRPASEIKDAAVNFNSRNDRNATLPATPGVLSDLTAVDHVVNKDGSADISFEWSYDGATEAHDIDGFFVYVYSSSAPGTYLFGTNPAKEMLYPVSFEKRSFIVYGVPADQYYTFGVQAYREVDQDIAASGVLKSVIRKATAASENPYRPESSVAFTGDVKGTIDGIPAEDLETKDGASGKADRAIDEANLYTNKLRDALTMTRTEVWLRHLLSSDVFAKKNPTLNVYGAPRGTLFTGVTIETKTVEPRVESEAVVHYLSALCKAYVESANPDHLTYLNNVANFISTRFVQGYFGGVGIAIVPTGFDYDVTTKTFAPDTYRVPLRLMYETAAALMNAFSITSDVRYRDQAGELMDSLAYLRKHIKNRTDNSTLAAYMSGAQYEELFSSNGTDFTVNENVFSNTLTDAVVLAANAFPADAQNRTNKGGTAYIVSDEATSYRLYIRKLETDGRLERTTAIPVMNEFMHFDWSDDVGTDGRYLPSPKNRTAEGNYETAGIIRTAIQAKSARGLGLAEETFATKYLDALLPLRVADTGNDILFHAEYSELGIPAAGSVIDLSVTAAIFAGRYAAGVTEDLEAFVQTIKSNQLRSFNRQIDGAVFRNKNDQSITDSGSLAFIATTPINQVAMKGGLDSIFLDIQQSTYDLDDKINTLDNYVETAFADGVISEMEARTIEMYLNQIDNEKASSDSRYQQLIDLGISNLEVKSSLQTAKSSYDQAYGGLRNHITVSVGDRDITEAEKETVDNLFDAYRESFGTLQAITEVYVATQSQEKATGALQDAQAYTNNILVNYVNKALYQQDIEELKKQVDGNVTTWFFGYDPTPTNEPMDEWITPSLKNQHLGDVFYNTESGHAFRFALVEGVYTWISIQDTDIQLALQQAAAAQDTADNKRRVFVVQPIPPYDAGDLWVQGDAGDILTAITPKEFGQNYSSVDWKLASKYTNDARAIQAEINAKAYADTMKLEIDSEISGLSGSLNGLNEYLEDTFRDEVVTAAEAKAIQTHIKIMDNEKADVDNRYAIISANTALSAGTKQSLTSAKTAYDAGHTNVVAVIQVTIADSKVLDAERASIDAEFAAYRNALAALSSVLETAINEIATKKATDAEASAKAYTKGLTDAIESDVNDITGRLGTLDTYLDEAYKDNIVDEAEALAIKTHIEQLNNEKAGVDNRYLSLHGNSYLPQILKDELATVKNSWDAAHGALVASIQNSIVEPKITLAERATIDSNFVTYRTRMATLSERLEEAVYTIVDVRAVESEEGAAAYADLLKLGIDSEMQTLSNTFEGFKGNVEGAFKDGIIEESEAQSIGTYLNTLRTEKQDLDNRYATLFANPDLLDPEKAALATAKSEFDTAQSSLIATVNVSIVDGRATLEERHSVNLKFDNYTAKLGTLAIRLEEAINSVAAKKSGDAVKTAKAYADDMKTAFNQDIADVDGRVSTLNSYLDGAFQDGILDEAEKLTIKSHVEQITTESRDVDGRYNTVYADVLLTGTAKTNLAANKASYTSAFNGLMNAITAATNDEDVTAAERDALTAAFNIYRVALADFSSAFAIAVNAISQVRAYNAEYNAKQYTDTQLDGYVSAVLFDQTVEELQRQSDGGIMTWFYNYVPSLTVAPAIEWTDTAELNMHLGDLFYNTATGYAYRFGVIDTVYQWIRIQDSDVEAALNKASKAQDTADAKRRTFVVTPTVPYDVGDLWLNSTTKDIMSAKVAKIVGQSYSAADWEKASKYTDDTRAVAAETNAKSYADTMKTALQGEISGVTTSVGNLDSYVKGSFRDGIIETTEAKAIATYINTLSAEKEDVDKRYSALTNNPDLVDPAKAAMVTAKTAFNTAHTNLINAINNAIVDGFTTVAEKATVDSSFASYRVALGTLSTRMEEAIDSVAAKKAGNAQAAATALVTALQTAVADDISDVNERIDVFSGYVDAAFKDGIIQEAEAKAIAVHLENIDTEKADLDKRYDTIYANALLSGTEKTDLLSKKTAYNTAHTNLRSGITTAIADGKTTTAEATTVKTLFTAYRSAISNIAISFENAINLIAQKKADQIKDYVQSRGENLVTNGTGLLGNNTNFSTFTFDGAQVFAGGGSFYTESQSGTRFNDEFIPIDPSKKIRVEMMAKSKTGLGHNYMGMVTYDVDKNSISDISRIASNFPVVSLAQDLKVGDTVMYLTSLDGFVDNVGDNSHFHSFVLWGYKNSFGYEYPPGTYTRFNFASAWLNGAINVAAKTITFSRPFSVTNPSDPTGVFRAGHKISRSHNGSGYLYSVAGNVKVPTTWTKFSGDTYGMGDGSNKFPYGSAYLKLLFLVNRSSSGGTAGDALWINSISVTDVTLEDNAKAHTDAIKLVLDKEISDVETLVTDFQTTVNTSFRDGVISEAETKAIASNVQLLTIEKSDVDKRYLAIYGNAALVGTPKTDLGTAKSTYDAAHSGLIATINSAISNKEISAPERTSVDAKFVTYQTSLSDLTTKLESAIDAIASKKSNDVQVLLTQNLADYKTEINQDISDVDGRVTGLNTYIDGTFEDGLVSQAEARAIGTHVQQISNEKADLDNRFTALNADVALTGTAKTNLSTAKTAYNTSHATLLTSINTVVTAGSVTAAQKTTIQTNFNDYRTKLATLATRFEEAATALTTKKADDAKIAANQATSTALAGYVTTTALGQSLTQLQSQIDGSITTWFYDYVPTLTNLPTTDWTTAALKNQHLGDIFYDNVSGFAYRFALESTTYKWIRIQDSDVELALEQASKAQDTADSKRRVFVVQPVAPYDIGDLWVQGATGDIMKAKVAKALGGSYSVLDWEKAAKYTDDSRAVEAENAAKAAAATLANAAQTAAENAAKAHADGVVSAAETRLLNADNAILASALVSDKIKDFGSAFKVFQNITAYSNATSSLVGAIVIDTGITMSDKMCRIDISGYNYKNAETEIDITLGFYARSNLAFANMSFTDKGTAKIPSVRLGHKNGKVSIILGDVGTVWQYPKIIVNQAVVSHSTTSNTMGDGWSTTAKTLLTDYVLTADLPKRDLEDKFGASEKVRIAKEAILSHTNTELGKTNDAVFARVEKKDIHTYYAQNMKVRFIRDWLKGNSVNTGNHWVEIQAYANGENVAQRLDETGVTQTVLIGGSGTVSNPEALNNGVIDNLYTTVSGDTTVPQYIQIDLGSVRADLEFLRVWHYFTDGRTYNNTKTEVSADGVTWFTVFDSAVTGLYPETPDGNLIPVNQGQFFMNYQTKMADIIGRVSTAEEIINADSIVSTVMQSVSFTQAMNGKAGSDLSAYATNTGVDTKLGTFKTTLDGEVNTKLDLLDLNRYEKFTKVEQKADRFALNFKHAGGVNISPNSAGFAGFDFWTKTGAMSVRQNSTDLASDIASEFFSENGEGGYIEQNLVINSSSDYSVSFLLNKTVDNATTGDAGIQFFDELGGIIDLFDADGVSLVGFLGKKAGSGITTGYETFSATFKPNSANIKMRVNIGTGAVAGITKIMVNIGDSPLQWTMAPGEIYNTNVRNDMNGIKVSKIVDGKVVQLTAMTTDKFAGYSDQNGDGIIDTAANSPDEIFKMDENEFVMKNARIKEETIIGPVKILKIESTANTGIAFIGAD